MKIYLAGPMRGIPHFNFPAFKQFATALRAEGHEVFSPAEKGEEAELDNSPSQANVLAFRRRVFALDTDWICNNADAVALMPGWENSPGAIAEHALARAIGLKMIYLAGESNAKAA